MGTTYSDRCHQSSLDCQKASYPFNNIIHSATSTVADGANLFTHFNNTPLLHENNFRLSTCQTATPCNVVCQHFLSAKARNARAHSLNGNSSAAPAKKKRAKPRNSTQSKAAKEADRDARVAAKSTDPFVDSSNSSPSPAPATPTVVSALRQIVKDFQFPPAAKQEAGLLLANPNKVDMQKVQAHALFWMQRMKLPAIPTLEEWSAVAKTIAPHMVITKYLEDLEHRLFPDGRPVKAAPRSAETPGPKDAPATPPNTKDEIAEEKEEAEELSDAIANPVGAAVDVGPPLVHEGPIRRGTAFADLCFKILITRISTKAELLQLNEQWSSIAGYPGHSVLPVRDAALKRFAFSEAQKSQVYGAAAKLLEARNALDLGESVVDDLADCTPVVDNTPSEFETFAASLQSQMMPIAIGVGSVGALVMFWERFIGGRVKHGNIMPYLKKLWFDITVLNFVRKQIGIRELLSNFLFEMRRGVSLCLHRIASKIYPSAGSLLNSILKTFHVDGDSIHRQLPDWPNTLLPGSMGRKLLIVAAVLLLLTTRRITKHMAELFEPRGIRADIIQPLLPVAPAGIVVLPAAVPTTIDRVELQKTATLTVLQRVVRLKGPNLYTWWYSISPDLVDVIDGVVTPGYFTETSTSVHIPATFIAEASSWCLASGDCTRASMAIITHRCLGYTVPTTLPAHVKNNVTAYGPYMAWRAARMLQTFKHIPPDITSTYGDILDIAKIVGGVSIVLALTGSLLAGNAVDPASRMFRAENLVPLYVIFGAPFFEELLKRYFPRSTYLLIAGEAFGAWHAGILPRYIPAGTMHLITHYRNSTNKGGRLWSNMVLHSCFNFLASFLNGDAILLHEFAPQVAEMIAGWGGEVLVPASVFSTPVYQAVSKFQGFPAYLLENAPKVAAKVLGANIIKRVFPHCPYMQKPIQSIQVQYGLSSESYRPVAYANNANNFEAALRQRSCYVDPLTDSAAAHVGRVQFINFWRNNDFENLRKVIPLHHVKCIPLNACLERMNSKPSVKMKIREADKKNKQTGIRRDTPLSRSDQETWTRLDCFTKVENLNYRTPVGVNIKMPRIVMGSKPEFVALVMPFVMAVSDHIKSNLDGSKGILNSSGRSAQECSDYLGSDNGYIDEETDVGHWDKSVHRDLREFEFDVYCRMCPPVAVKQLMKLDSRRTKGVAASGILFTMMSDVLTTCAQRPSGRPDTSIWNALLNALIRLYGFCIVWGIDVETVMRMIKILVQGDDGASRSSSHMPRVDWTAVFASVGFELEYRWVTHPRFLSFCSMLNYPVEGGLCFGPKPGRIFGKTCYIINPRPKDNLLGILRGVALGLSQPATFIKPLSMWCSRVLELTQGATTVPFSSEEWQMQFSTGIANCETELFLAQRYGWCPDMEVALAKELSLMTLGGGEGGLIYNYFIEIDSDGPAVSNRFFL